MATAKFNSKSPTIKRILREAQELSTSPSPDYTASPLETDLFEWHFTLRGPPDSAFAEGLYHGRIVLPPTYPLRPPSFRFLTPSGRFEANREICLSISGHHEETWQPAWGVRTALVALRSFMETDPRGQLGGLESPEPVRRRLATESRSYRCPTCARANADIIAEAEAAAREFDEQERAAASSCSSADPPTARKEVEIPAELKMGWRDEMGKPSATAPPAAPGGSSDDGSESAELAEGFVQTVPIQSRQNVPEVGVGAGSSTSVSLNPHLQNRGSAPQPTRTAAPRLPIAPQPQQFAVGAPQGLLQQRHTDDGVPAWVDRAIVLVGIMLIVMFLKVLL